MFIYSFILNLCLVTAERFIGVVFPLRYHAILAKSRMVKFLTAVCIASFLLSIPYCNDNPSSQTLGRVVWVLVICFALLFSFYRNIKILCIAKDHKRRIVSQAEACRQMSQMVVANQQRFRGVGTVFCILSTPLLCYFPATFIRFVQANLDDDKQKTFSLLKPWTSTSFVMYSAISPFVYFFFI